jgi:hypothetical protein
MILGFLFKLFLFYILFLFIRGLYKAYKTLQVFKGAQEQFKDQWKQSNGHHYGGKPDQPSPEGNSSQNNTIEAEYRVLDESSEENKDYSKSKN